MNILGVHIGHDSCAALVNDGAIVADAGEERFNRIKHYGGMPLESIGFCLDQGGLTMDDIDVIALSGSLFDPRLKVTFQLSEYDMNQAVKSVYGTTLKLENIKRKIKERAFYRHSQPPDYIKTFKIAPHTKVVKVDHHLAHAASAYYTSGFQDDCLIITSDGAGDANSMCVYRGAGGQISRIKEFGHTGSIGWFYGLITEALGWWVGDGEGKTMGLAPYGDPDAFDDALLEAYMPKYVAGLLAQPHDYRDVSQLLWHDTYHWHFDEAADVQRLIQKHGAENVAAKAQYLLEREMLVFIRVWVEKERANRLATSGGVFLNVKLNQKVVESHIVEEYHIFPNAGDSGLALGAALYTHHRNGGGGRISKLEDLYMGPEYSNDTIECMLHNRNLNYRSAPDVAAECAELLAGGRIVGWFQGRMECGPRALGGRSILFDAGKPENKDIINARVKFREPFRPFCPSMTAECAAEYLYETRDERFMITAYRVKPQMAERIPAVVHVDGTCRPQFVHEQGNPKFWRLLDRFGEITGTPVILNTSFNVKGEPIICSPSDAIKCFFDTGMDVLAIEDFLVYKNSG